MQEINQACTKAVPSASLEFHAPCLGSMQASAEFLLSPWLGFSGLLPCLAVPLSSPSFPISSAAYPLSEGLHVTRQDPPRGKTNWAAMPWYVPSFSFCFCRLLSVCSLTSRVSLSLRCAVYLGGSCCLPAATTSRLLSLGCFFYASFLRSFLLPFSA